MIRISSKKSEKENILLKENKKNIQEIIENNFIANLIRNFFFVNSNKNLVMLKNLFALKFSKTNKAFLVIEKSDWKIGWK